MTTNLDKQCALLLARPERFKAFVDATHAEFARMANHLLRRWVATPATDPCDIVQELYIGAWHTLFGSKPFDPTRGVTVARYVAWGAMTRAKRAIHRDRGASLSGSADKNPSHIAKPFSAFGREGDDTNLFLDALLVDERPNAEKILIMAETRAEAIARALHVCTTPRERLAIMAIDLGGSVDGAGAVLYDDFDTRIALRFGSEEHAARFVSRAALTVASRLDATAS